MVLPNVIHGEGGLSPHVTYDHENNKVTAYGRICGGIKVNGSTVSEKVRQQIRMTGQSGDDAGHIIPRCWGGSGISYDNIFPQHAAWNRSNGHMERGFGYWLAASERHSIEFEYFFEYEKSNSSNPNRPSKYTVSIVRYIDGKAAEAPYKYSELNRDYTPADQSFIDQQMRNMHYDNNCNSVLANLASMPKPFFMLERSGHFMNGKSTSSASPISNFSVPTVSSSGVETVTHVGNQRDGGFFKKAATAVAVGNGN
uniref:Uncharacterized protein n=1 Tax=Panagrolaimus sp. ES5 TaxID=591445 RepID=A0AC34FLG4_9BILA